ncbi:DUF1003 domain-containing protein [Nocardia sp. alder85J]|uniref:DUF1003 domain-containing protein n=1 Tax=Nocardia sp. alder85J TaxID=2862949 RepID=UPI001CD4E1C0|nr:DUF1003 domain-containing protein [Nocardia sp. alder85J]MCX4094225.1 DUF1003 domain-containing protein [Nocardia sp. alder85J]
MELSGAGDGGEQQVPVRVERRIGWNDTIAAVLTQRVGSMTALYVALVIVGGWTILAIWGPLRAVDPYPFKFLLFLDNIVQLVLCLVILVGQRVLSVAADRRAVQTYENTEAVFDEVARLQTHLDRHDRMLSRGVSMLESSPHPWIERHRVQPPPQARDHAIGLNDRIAAWLTQRLGSVWTFYLAAVTQLLWMMLAEFGIQRFDPYPFAFMTFLSTLAQLIFMIVIMVGQDVLDRTGDRRAEQTFLDAEAILYECRRMQARLTAQDRVIDSLTGYMTTQVTEQLAQAVHATEERVDHQARVHAVMTTGAVPERAEALREWVDLPEERKRSYRVQARRLGENLTVVGCVMMPAGDPALDAVLEEAEVKVLARLEYERRMADKTMQRARYSPGRRDRDDAQPLPWDELPDLARIKYLQAARLIPEMLARAGFQVLRRDHAGPTEADFTAAQWATLHRALMAAGIVVALDEDGADYAEITALINAVRQVSLTHPSRFLRELTATSVFDTTLRADTSYADYEGPALTAIRSATAIVADCAPDELAGFRALLIQIAETVAETAGDGLFGVDARPDGGAAVLAVTAVRQAAGLVDHTAA